jgi:hypothetical protein
MEAVAENNEQATEPTNPEEVLEPSVAHREQRIGKDDYEFIFVQKPLSFIGKLDFFSVLGKALSQSLSGPDAINIADLLEVPERGAGGLSKEDLADADVFVKGISKLLMYAPDIITDLYCVLLAVPKGHREVVKELMALPAEEGGLSDEDGVAVFETGIDQNLEVIKDFFTQRIAPLVEKLSPKTDPASASSKP